MVVYESPLVTRAASKEMAELWGEHNKIRIWRQLWIALAKAQMSLGLDIITDQKIADLEAHLEDIDLERAAEIELETRHDVMAHIKAYGEKATIAKGIIHLGATSQFVVDNADIIRVRQAANIIEHKLALAIISIGEFAKKHADVPTVGLTHLQSAQPTTVGKRAAMWGYDLYLCLQDFQHKAQGIKARGAKGATGTSASYLELFGDDVESAENVEYLVSRYIDIPQFHPYIGQVYPRVADSLMISSLANIAAVCQKIATDLRILASRDEVLEIRGDMQVGSSAMPYKRNPIMCEKVCGLSRVAMGFASTALTTTAEIWMERSLDDSIARRIYLPESFLALDGILDLMGRSFNGLQIEEFAIKKALDLHIPDAAMENELMRRVKGGEDRQEVHEELMYSEWHPSGFEFRKDCYVGLAPKQARDFFKKIVEPLQQRYTG